jgi:Tfp pilus assembly protein PilO
VQVKTKNIVVSVLVVLFVGLAWYQFVYSPMASSASKSRAAAKDANTNADNLRKAISGTNSAKKKTKNNDPSTDLMQAALPVDAAESSFLRSVDALRVSSGADWQSITPTAPVISGTVSTISVGITVQGTEDELAQYASGLGDLQRLFVMDNLAISAASGSSGVPGGTSGRVLNGHFNGGATLQMQISGRIFSQPGAIASATTGAAGSTTPAAGAAAPTGGTGSTPAVQNS